jgi:hypothetical protein
MDSHGVRNFGTSPKATSATIIIGTTVTVAILLSGLLLTGVYQVAIAQQSIMEDEATTTMGARNATNTSTTATGSTIAEGEGNQSSVSQVRMILEEVLNALQNRDTRNAKVYLDEAINDTLGWELSNTTAGSSSTGDNTSTNTSVRGSSAITSLGSQGGTSDVGDGTSVVDNNNNMRTQTQIEGSSTTGNNNDATNAGNGADINGNTVGNSPEINTRQSDQATSECGGMTVGGTSAADDYGCDDQDAD